MKYNILFSCISHIGKCRSVNQDNFLCNGQYMKLDNSEVVFPLEGEIQSENYPVVLGIFDGMGGEECGEVAAYIAAKNFAESILSKDIVSDLKKIYFDTNEKICDYIIKNKLSSMGTTAATLVFSNKEIILSNIGDSKIFLFSDKKLAQISVDHIITSSLGGGKSPLTQNLGIPTTELMIEPYIAQGCYNNGDIYLICSDGLTDMVTFEEILSVLSNTKFENISNVLLEKALANGGKDNITLIVCKVKRDFQWLPKRLINKIE